MTEKCPKIKGVAVLYDDTVYHLPRPKHHKDLVEVLKRIYKDYDKDLAVKGFFTDKKDFITRERAARLALKSGVPEDDIKKYPELHSSDLW